MTPQEADGDGERFSFWPLDDALPRTEKRQMPCYQVYTTEVTADIVRNNLSLAPLYQGKIEGIGARYCPSFEDKVVRFADHPRHLLHLEPEGEFTGEYYINGISTSLPPEIQHKMIHSVPGLENAVISRYAYAIEYDFLFPDQIDRNLSVKKWPNLFTAGQINGTSGYEEAAGQGLLAGANAALSAAGRPLLEIGRQQAYLGVMIDDLVTKEIVEPYRLFTSRAEYRLHLRQDNADLRLCELAYQSNLLPLEHYRCFLGYRKLLETSLSLSQQQKYEGKSLFSLLKTHNSSTDDVTLPFPADLLALSPERKADQRVIRQLKILAHYDGYLEREKQAGNKLLELEKWRIPADFDYSAIPGLCNEARLKLQKIKPQTLAQASRIDGVTPAELSLLQIHLRRRQGGEKG